jgi:hypothetical protein
MKDPFWSENRHFFPTDCFLSSPRLEKILSYPLFVFFFPTQNALKYQVRHFMVFLDLMDNLREEGENVLYLMGQR